MDDYDLSYSYYDNDEQDLEKLRLDYESYDVHDACVIPTVQGIAHHLSWLLLWNLVFRICTQTVFVHIHLCHLLSITCGLVVLHTLIDVNFMYIALFCILSYLMIYGISFVCKKYHSSVIATSGMTLLVLCELLSEGTTWQHIRAVYMILVMKMISLAFDLEIGRVTIIPDILSYCGYLLCPANSVFGPWIPYKQYLSIFSKPAWNWLLIPQVLIKATTSLFFLLVSSCWVLHFIPTGSWRWFEAYRDALSFRTSNYFISYLAEMVMIIGGYSQNYKILDGSISNPYNIELPRSLMQVVIHWNVPMHMWLKTYIFREARRFGVFPAICLTYIVSSLLHGLNFKLAAVLLSIGLYSYIEFRLRNKLANIFSACINVNKCVNCQHLYRDKNIYVIIGNLFFSFIAILHLAYLGMVFDSNGGDHPDTGYDYKYTLNKWAALDYTSHWIALIFYIIYLLV